MRQAEQALVRPLGPQELIVFVGLPGSGKSTLYHRLFAATHAHISLDLLRRRSRERSMIEEQLVAGRSLVIDNTNVLRSERASYLEMAGRYRVPVRCIHLQIDLRAALQRNAARQGKARIPDVGVIAKYKAFEAPQITEGFSRLQRIRIAEDGAVELIEELRARRRNTAGRGGPP